MVEIFAYAILSILVLFILIPVLVGLFIVFGFVAVSFASAWEIVRKSF